jgi:PAS domain S-box-containing protein
MVEHFEKHKTELRQRAEARVGSFSAALAKAPQDIQGLVHELNVHQVELEMQYEELQRGQEQVEESRDRYADLYESAPVGYFTLLKDGTIVEVNHAGAALMGVAPFDLKERRFQLMVAMNDREAFTTFCQRVLDTQEPGSCEVRLELPKSGSGDDQRRPPLTVLIQAGPVRAGLGKKRHLRVAAMDITERKRVEEQLRRSETNLADGQRISRTGSWTWKASSEELFCSKELLRIFGLEPGTKPSHEDFLRIIHPEDQARVRDSFIRALRAGTEYEAKYRIVLSDGSVRHIRNLGHPLLNQSGRLIEYVGTAIDTTEGQRTEEALRASEERFRSYFEQGLIGMAMTSSTKGILEVNDELCRILGYSRSELLQKTWAEMTHPGDLAADVSQFNRIMAGEINAYTMDKRWIRKDGRTIDTIMTVKCVRRADGSVDYFVELVLEGLSDAHIERFKGMVG